MREQANERDENHTPLMGVSFWFVLGLAGSVRARKKSNGSRAKIIRKGPHSTPHICVGTKKNKMTGNERKKKKMEEHWLKMGAK